ncbi:MAG: hypothetical protein JWO10_2250 [Microbacteriaceae bacterium]|nr:hypothetical protein [Microbacteriaceae bacterium]
MNMTLVTETVPKIVTSRPLPRSSDLLAGVRALRPLIESKAEEATATGHIADEVVQALYDAGYMTMFAPAELGGGEAEPSVLLDCVEEAAYADGSTGWATMASATGVGVLMATLPDQAVERVMSSGNFLIAGSIPRPGTARRVDGGFIVSGKFSFASGSAQAGWFSGAYFEVDAEGNRVPDANGSPYPMLTLIPRSETQLLGNWDVSGLVATASIDYGFTDVFVPDFMFTKESTPNRGGALYTMGAKAVPGIGHTGFALGVGQRVLDEFKIIASTKQRPPSGLLSKHHTLQRDFAIWTTKLGAARSYAHDTFNRLYEAARDGTPITPVMWANCRMAATNAVFVAAEIAQGAYIASGADGLRNGSVFQRAVNDISAATQHMYTAEHNYVSAGRVYLETPGLTDAHRAMMTTTFAPPLD